MRKGARQEVTGIVVNKQAGINRKTLHRFRALIQQISKHGLENKKWKGGNIVSEMIGYANFVAQVKPAQGAKFKTQLKDIFSRPALQQQIQQLGLNITTTPKNTISIPKADIKEKKEDGKDWWDVV